MKLFSGPECQVMLIHMPAQIDMGLVTEEKKFQKFRIILNTLSKI